MDDAERAARARDEQQRELARLQAGRETFDWVSNFNRTQASQIEQDNLRAERACGAEKRVADAGDDGLRNLDAPPPRTSDPVPDATARPDADVPSRPPPDPPPTRPLSPPGVPTDPALRELLPSDPDTATRLLSDLTLIGDRIDAAAALRENGNVAQAQAAECAAREVYDFWSAFYRNQERLALIVERLHELTVASIEGAEADRVAGQAAAQTLDEMLAQQQADHTRDARRPAPDPQEVLDDDAALEKAWNRSGLPTGAPWRRPRIVRHRSGPVHDDGPRAGGLCRLHLCAE
jgi:hypothetical protein